MVVMLQENVMLKEQAEGILRENTILKRAVAIQHERQKEYDERNQEVQHMKQVVAQYQEQLRNLEVDTEIFFCLCNYVHYVSLSDLFLH